MSFGLCLLGLIYFYFVGIYDWLCVGLDVLFSLCDCAFVVLIDWLITCLLIDSLFYEICFHCLRLWFCCGFTCVNVVRLLFSFVLLVCLVGFVVCFVVYLFLWWMLVLLICILLLSRSYLVVVLIVNVVPLT